MLDLFRGATYTEIALVRGITPCVKIYSAPGGMYAYKGHAVTLMSDSVVEFSATLPRRTHDCGIRVIQRAGEKQSSSSSMKKFTVRVSYVMRMLDHLLRNHPYYGEGGHHRRDQKAVDALVADVGGSKYVDEPRVPSGLPMFVEERPSDDKIPDVKAIVTKTVILYWLSHADDEELPWARACSEIWREQGIDYEEDPSLLWAEIIGTDQNVAIPDHVPLVRLAMYALRSGVAAALEDEDTMDVERTAGPEGEEIAAAEIARQMTAELKTLKTRHPEFGHSFVPSGFKCVFPEEDHDREALRQTLRKEKEDMSKLPPHEMPKPGDAMSEYIPGFCELWEVMLPSLSCGQCL